MSTRYRSRVIDPGRDSAANPGGVRGMDQRCGRPSMLILLWLGALLGCGDDPAQPGGGTVFVPTEPMLLSAGSPTKDEDPSLLRARDGTLFVAWFSDRGANADIYVTSTANGTEWNTPVRVTQSPEADFHPSLFQAADGSFHLVWFRWHAFQRGHIWYNTSPDGRSWNPANEQQVTDVADVDDWVPTITQSPDGALWTTFVSEVRDTTNSTSEIYAATKRSGQSDWDAAVPLSTVNSAVAHDHLPFLMRTGNTMTLVWTRHESAEPLPWLNPRTDVYYSTSADGTDWEPAKPVTPAGGVGVNLFPALYPNLDGVWSLVWLSTRSGSLGVWNLPLTAFDDAPTAAVENTLLPDGYSHRIAPTSTPGVFLAAWVQGPEGAQDIYYRFFRPPTIAYEARP